MAMNFTISTILAILYCSGFSSEFNAQSLSKSAHQPELKLGYVKYDEIGCGCSFSRNKTDLRNRRFVYFENFHDAPYINLNGRNLKLLPVASSEEHVEEKVGQRSWETFTAGDLKIR